jgi:hypothetical protein
MGPGSEVYIIALLLLVGIMFLPSVLWWITISHIAPTYWFQHGTYEPILIVPIRAVGFYGSIYGLYRLLIYTAKKKRKRRSS